MRSSNGSARNCCTLSMVSEDAGAMSPNLGVKKQENMKLNEEKLKGNCHKTDRPSCIHSIGRVSPRGMVLRLTKKKSFFPKTIFLAKIFNQRRTTWFPLQHKPERPERFNIINRDNFLQANIHSFVLVQKIDPVKNPPNPWRRLNIGNASFGKELLNDSGKRKLQTQQKGIFWKSYPNRRNEIKTKIEIASSDLCTSWENIARPIAINVFHSERAIISGEWDILGHELRRMWNDRIEKVHHFCSQVKI